MSGKISGKRKRAPRSNRPKKLKKTSHTCDIFTIEPEGKQNVNDSNDILLPKPLLVHSIAYYKVRDLAARKIQKAFRKYSKLLANHTDIITQAPLCHVEQTLFRLKQQDKIFRFVPVHLAQFIESNALFHNPYNQQPIELSDLRRLMSLVWKTDPSFPDLADPVVQIRLKKRQQDQLNHDKLCENMENEIMTNVGPYLERARSLDDLTDLYDSFEVFLEDYFVQSAQTMGYLLFQYQTLDQVKFGEFVKTLQQTARVARAEYTIQDPFHFWNSCLAFLDHWMQKILDMSHVNPNPDPLAQSASSHPIQTEAS